jgi:hypothetical protein
MLTDEPRSDHRARTNPSAELGVARIQRILVFPVFGVSASGIDERSQVRAATYQQKPVPRRHLAAALPPIAHGAELAELGSNRVPAALSDDRFRAARDLFCCKTTRGDDAEIRGVRVVFDPFARYRNDQLPEALEGFEAA